MLDITGYPSGSVYFDQGQVTFARAAGLPDLGCRLCGALGASADLRDLLRGEEEAGRDVGALLVRGGYISPDALRDLLRSVMVDAVIALTRPAGPVSDITFDARGAHWAGTFGGLEVSSVQAEAEDRARLMAAAGVTATTPVVLCDVPWATVVTREQWALAAVIDQPRSALDLAWARGLALYDAVGGVGDLIGSGLCQLADLTREAPIWVPRQPGAAELAATSQTRPELVPPDQARASRAPAERPRPEQPQAEQPSPEQPSPEQPQAEQPSAERARPRHGRTEPGPSGAPTYAGTAWPASFDDNAAPELLHRVLNGLRNLG